MTQMWAPPSVHWAGPDSNGLRRLVQSLSQWFRDDVLLARGGGRGWFLDDSTSGSAATLDINRHNAFGLTLTANCTLTFTLDATSQVGSENRWCTFELLLTQDGTGSRTVTWPGSVTWPGGTAPTLSTGAGDVDWFRFSTPDGGTTWHGEQVGLNMV